MSGFSYDNSRKLNTNNKNFAPNPSGGANALSMYNPVPYDFNFDLNIYVRTVEDGNQIIEQILPFFTPDYSLRLNLVPEMSAIKVVPIVLNRVTQTIESDGDYSSDVRIIIWSLGFTVKGYIFGAVKDTKLIANTNINMTNSSGISSKFETGDGACCSNEGSKSFNMQPNGYGNYQNAEIVYQGQSLDYAFASGKVQYWDSNTNLIIISDVCGTFKLNQPIVGVESFSIHIPTSSASTPHTILTFNAKPDPLNASANGYFTANVTYKEVT